MGHVLKLAQDDSQGEPQARLSSSDVIKGETRFAVREEMAHKLTDILLRRTDRGTAGPCPKTDLVQMSALMGEEMGWDEARRESEIAEARKAYPPFLPSRSNP
jgi:glycerol-3-phosphate dehydrogenase